MDYAGGETLRRQTGVSISLMTMVKLVPYRFFRDDLQIYSVQVPGGTHGDMTSGIAAGAGNLDPTKKGMGSGAWLGVHDVGAGPGWLRSYLQCPFVFYKLWRCDNIYKLQSGM